MILMKSTPVITSQQAIPVNIPPYQFSVVSTQTMINDPYLGPEERTTYGYLMDNLNPNYITLVDIDKKLIPLMEATDNEIFYRRLFLNNLFINSDFHFGKYIVKGIFIYELKPLDEVPDLEELAESIGWKEAYSEYNVTFLSYVVDTKAETTFVIPGVLVSDPTDKDKNIPLKLKNNIRRYICNVLDFVNNGAEDEINIVTVEASEKRNEKRAKRGKLPQPTVIHIRPRSKFLKYIDEFNKSSRKKAQHKFQVRGHFRHYKNKRYSEERRSKPRWIRPYYKGKGIFIKKSYQLNGESGD